MKRLPKVRSTKDVKSQHFLPDILAPLHMYEDGKIFFKVKTEFKRLEKRQFYATQFIFGNVLMKHVVACVREKVQLKVKTCMEYFFFFYTDFNTAVFIKKRYFQCTLIQ